MVTAVGAGGEEEEEDEEGEEEMGERLTVKRGTLCCCCSCFFMAAAMTARCSRRVSASWAPAARLALPARNSTPTREDMGSSKRSVGTGDNCNGVHVMCERE